MLRNLKYLFLVLVFSAVSLGFQKIQENDPEKDKLLISLIRYALSKGHYEPVAMNDAFSEKVYDDFLANLDQSKRMFLQEDIDEFSEYKFLIDDQLKNEDLTFFNLVYDRYLQRFDESKVYYNEILAMPFDFKKEGQFNYDYEAKPYASNQAELIQVWRDQLKLTTITRLHEKIEMDKNRFEKDSTYRKNSYAILEQEAREGTKKSMDEYYDFMGDLDQMDWFSVYINSITLAFDPHTNYMAPKDKKRFDISIAGKLEGIGARLRKKDDYVTVDELISGGPAWRGGELEVGDAILKVGEGEGEPKDIIGMRLDDAIEFIKGKKGTEVRLTVLKIDGSLKVIPIIRDVVEMDETFAKSTIIKKGDKKFGMIELPKFYIDFEEKDYRNSTTDMIQEIERLKEENVEGILIDLRNNGGGSLKTAIEIAGLFIKEGPIVQVKYRDEKPVVKYDTDKTLQYDGSLVILVNELSASASEIFAAAMQDYNRAVIIGSEQTFGKGTVQNLLPLNNYYKYDEDLGALKMTIQKFYRIDGGSTQLKGVSSDIAIPDRYTYLEIGERDEKNPLNWDKVEPANYKPMNYYENFNSVIQDSKQRILANPQFKLIDANAKWLKESSTNTVAYLNYDAYKIDLVRKDQEAKAFEKLNDYKNNLIFSSPQYELAAIEKDSILREKREIWHKNLNKDIYVEEAVNVLASLKVRKDNLLVKN
ncbi:MAG: carboxy terminal-processing peptidase [Flavobacteriaceae bacterium]|nr:carboxy terminal-processing peptidase [Flavobacteriaceae bacterium]